MGLERVIDRLEKDSRWAREGRSMGLRRTVDGLQKVNY